MRNYRALALLLAGLVAAAGCSSHGASVLPGVAANSPSFVMSNGVSHRPGDLTLDLEIPAEGGADFTKAFPGFVPSPGATYHHITPDSKQLLIQGILYPSYAATNTPRNGIVVPLPKKGVIKATMSFSNVTVANNQWTIFNIYETGSDGSYTYIGSEAAVINIKQSNPTKITVNPVTTQVYQLTLALVQAGLVDAQDLASQPKLTTAIALEIQKQHLKPDPTTGLFTVSTIDSFVRSQLPKWQRILTIEGGQGVREISVANDIQNSQEGNLNLNLRSLLGVAVDNTLRPPGSPCGQAVPAHLPGTHPSPAPQVCAEIYGTSTGKITIPVYGNQILIGGSNGTAPYMGVHQVVPARAGGTKVKVKLAKMQPSNLIVKTKDQFDWAFGTPPGVQVTYNTAPGNQPFAVTANYYTGFNYTGKHPTEWNVPSNYSAAHSSIAVNKWNPFGLSETSLQFCTDWKGCQDLSSTKVFDISVPFADPGTNPKYFNWKSVSGKIGTLKGCNGYVLTPKNGIITFTSSQPTSLVQNQVITFQYSQGGGCGSPAPIGTITQVQAIDTNGVMWSGQAIQSPPIQHQNVTMDTYQKITSIKKITITIKLPKGVSTPLNLVTIASQYTP